MPATMTFWSLALCILATAINIRVFLVTKPPAVLTFRDIARMRRPNQFAGLEKVVDLGDAPPVTIYPNLLSRISQKHPNDAYGDDPVKFATWGGFVAPEDRAFQVDSEFWTIAEFQSIDYKMENCQLVVRTPDVPTQEGLSLGPAENTVDIWRLEHDGIRYDIRTLSWKTRPSRKHFVDSIKFPLATNYTHSFTCPLNSLHGFEFSAATPATLVGWSQDYNNSNPAVVMIQTPSDK
ncbi:hypothetical protein B0H19DRAFT_394136 [Mycena capillaripes]|nr:hypothetical protein B0H19DRAFT_394136 [Mycena capillaripes]